jgi:hypothetical protein
MAVQVPRRLKDVDDACRRAGWDYDPTRDGHPRWMPPRGLRFEVDEQGSPIKGEVTFEGRGPLVPPVVFALTPSDHRGDRNARAALKRAGVSL